MRPLFVLLTIAALCVAAGCDKPDAKDRPASFDEKIDGNIAMSDAAADPSILNAPTKVAARPRRRAGSDSDADGTQPAEAVPDQPAEGMPPVAAAGEAPAANASASTGDAEIQAKQMLLKATNDAMNADYDSALSILMPSQANQLRPAIKQIKQVLVAYDRFDQACRSKLGSDAKTLLAGGSGATSFGEGMGDQLKMAMQANMAVGMIPMRAVSADEVQILGAGGQPSGVSLVQVDGRWRVQLPEEHMPMIVRISKSPAMKGYLQTLELTCNDLAEAIEADQITRDNFERAVQGMMTQRITPASMRIAQAIQTELTPKAEKPAKVHSPYGDIPLPENAYGPGGPGGGGGGASW